MSTENVAADPYSAVLADLRAKRAQIDQTINLLEALKGGSTAGPTTAVANGSFGPLGNNDIVETAGVFLGLSIVEAARKLLAMRKRTMGNVEIARELQAGGLVLTSAEPANVIGSVLTRRFNNVGDIVKMGRGIWGLKEWYPGRTFKASQKGIMASIDNLAEVAENSQKLADLGLVDDAAEVNLD